MMPRVSVIVPNYNHESFLQERIDTILCQTFQDFELILLDDCSTDGSRSIIEQYRGNSKVTHIVFNDNNGGSAFKQWDRGLSLASGELAWIAESDDAAEPTILETLVTEFDNDPQLVLAFCQTRLIDENGNQGEIHPIHEHLQESFNLSGRDFIRRWLSSTNYVVNASNALFKLSAYRNISLSFARDYKDFKGVGDWLFWLGIASFGDVAFVQKPLGRYRQHEHNTTSVLFASGKGSMEQANLLRLMERQKLISPYKALKMRVTNIVLLKKRDDIPPEALTACLKRWRADAPITSLWVYYKLFMHRGK